MSFNNKTHYVYYEKKQEHFYGEQSMAIYRLLITILSKKFALLNLVMIYMARAQLPGGYHNPEITIIDIFMTKKAE